MNTWNNFLRLSNSIPSKWIQEKLISSKRCLNPLLIPRSTSIRYCTYDGSPLLQPDTVHLKYIPGFTTMFYNEITVIESHPNTSIWACCFDSGYFGIREDNNGRKIATFSFQMPRNTISGQSSSDHGKDLHQESKNQTANNFRRSIFFPWKVGEPVPCILAVFQEPNGKTTYVASIHNNASKKWENVAKFQTSVSVYLRNRCKSFITDTKSSSGNIPRSACFNPWIRDYKGQWIQPTQAMFIHPGIGKKANAWAQAGHFFIATGGNVDNIIADREIIKRHISGVIPKVLTNIHLYIDPKQHQT